MRLKESSLFIDIFYSVFKGSILRKIDIFIIQEMFNKLTYGINTIIKCGIGQPVKFQLVSRS